MKVAFELDVKTVARWALAVILIWAAISKIANLHEFYLELSAYKLPLPDALVRFTVMVLPWLELLCGVILIAGKARQAALVWATILFAVFVVATGQAWMRGLEISCGCMKLDFLGPAVSKMTEAVWFAFFRAIILLGLAIFLLRQRQPAPATA